MNNFDSLLKIVSVKIYIKKVFVGTGVFYSGSNKYYVFTAAHVICGKEGTAFFNNTDISITFENVNCNGNYKITNIFIHDDYLSKDIDIAAIELQQLKFDPEIYGFDINDIRIPDAKLFFRGCPSQADNNYTNFTNYEYNEEVDEYKFIIKGPSTDFTHLSMNSDDSLNGISGSGVFCANGDTNYLYGIVVGCVNRDAAFGLLNCIKLSSLKTKLGLTLNTPIIKYSDICERINAFRNDIEDVEIDSFISKTNEQVCNLSRKMNVIVNGDIKDLSNKIRAHVLSYLYGDALLKYLQDNSPYIKLKHDKLLALT